MEVGSQASIALGEVPIKMKHVHIIWVDSCADGGIWVDIDSFGEQEIHYAESSGWVIHETDEIIVLAQTVGGLGDKRDRIVNWIDIPKVSIKETKEIG